MGKTHRAGKHRQHGRGVLHLRGGAGTARAETLGTCEKARAENHRQGPGERLLGAFSGSLPAGDGPCCGALLQPGGSGCGRPHVELDGWRVSLAQPGPGAEIQRTSRAQERGCAPGSRGCTLRREGGPGGFTGMERVQHERFPSIPTISDSCIPAPRSGVPANPLWPEPTGFPATMVGFPYDDVDGWRGPYPSETLASQFEKVAAGWAAGIPLLRNVVKKASSPEAKKNARDDLRIAEAAGLHFRSIANQVRFTLARNEFRTGLALTLRT